MNERYDRLLVTSLGKGTTLHTNRKLVLFQDLQEWCDTPQFSLPGKRFSFGHPFEIFTHRSPTSEMAIFIVQIGLVKLAQDLPGIPIEAIYGLAQSNGYGIYIKLDSIDEYFETNLKTNTA